MNVSVALRLGRVSNLPTVWTNMLAGIILVGGAADDPRVWPMAGAMSLFYVGGMYLNDAFDADIDAIERPERPIPSGQVRRTLVFRLGFVMLAFGIVLLAWAGFGWPGGTGMWPPLFGLSLAIAIIAYDTGNSDICTKRLQIRSYVRGTTWIAIRFVDIHYGNGCLR